MFENAINNNKILLVDDDQKILAAYRRLLRHKFILFTADSGTKGLAALEEQGPFAVIITDYRLPQMNGVDFLSAAREISPDSIRIVLTGHADVEATIDFINKGKVSYFLTKPCPSKQFIQTLVNALNQYQFKMDQRKEISSEGQQKTLDDTVSALVVMVEKKDPYTAHHQKRVSQLATAIAQKLSLPQERIYVIALAALIHDLGKIYVPAEILSKPGQITDTEKALIMTHPQAAYDVLAEINIPELLRQIVLQHHERIDGSGYPLGLSSSAIHFEACILAVADVVESMVSHRPYRPALNFAQALKEISDNKGVYYHPAVVDACCQVFEDGFEFA